MKDLRVDIPDAGKILLHNVYGWFDRAERGIYVLTDAGHAALRRWPQQPLDLNAGDGATEARCGHNATGTRRSDDRARIARDQPVCTPVARRCSPSAGCYRVIGDRAIQATSAD